MKVLVVMYWLWFGVSVFVLGRRGVRRVFGRSTPAAARRSADPGPAMIDSLAQRVHERAASAGTQVFVPAEDADAVEEPGDASSNTDLPTRDVGPSRVLPRPARSAVAGPRSSLADVIAGPRSTLADALAGIAMPSDLAPLMQVDGADMVRRAVFATTSATLERVDTEVLAELERLGYVLDRVGPHSSLARRGDDALALRVHLIGPQPTKGPADVNYPTAPAGSVVLDVELS